MLIGDVDVIRRHQAKAENASVGDGSVPSRRSPLFVCFFRALYQKSMQLVEHICVKFGDAPDFEISCVKTDTQTNGGENITPA